MPDDDPVLAAIERARQLPPVPEPERSRLLALDAEVKSDPSTWPSWESLLAEVAALPASDPVLSALLAAPVVPFTEAERRKVAEAMAEPLGWQNAEEFAAKVRGEG